MEYKSANILSFEGLRMKEFKLRYLTVSQSIYLLFLFGLIVFFIIRAVPINFGQYYYLSKNTNEDLKKVELYYDEAKQTGYLNIVPIDEAHKDEFPPLLQIVKIKKEDGDLRLYFKGHKEIFLVKRLSNTRVQLISGVYVAGEFKKPLFSWAVKPFEGVGKK